MRKKIIITIIMLSLVATLIMASGCSKSNNKVNTEKNNNITDVVEKENEKLGAEEKRILAGQVIEYKVD